MVTFPGIITVKCGVSEADCETISNVKEISWKRMPEDNLTPQTVMNSMNPIGFYQKHKWVEIELKVLSEAYHAFYHNGSTNKQYILENSYNYPFEFFQVTLTDSTPAQWIYNFIGTTPCGPSEPYKDGEDTIHIYRLKAKRVEITPPA